MISSIVITSHYMNTIKFKKLIFFGHKFARQYNKYYDLLVVF